MKLSNRLAPKLKIVPIVQTINIKTRRSNLSDIQPIGYCKIMPPKYIEATNNDISFTDKPLSVPQTEAIPNKAAKIAPRKNCPTTPKGEILQSCERVILLDVWNWGAGLTDSKIGANESDTTTEMMMNNTYPDGSAMFKTACAKTIPII